MLGISQHLFAINVLVWCVQSSIERSGKKCPLASICFYIYRMLGLFLGAPLHVLLGCVTLSWWAAPAACLAVFHNVLQ